MTPGQELLRKLFYLWQRNPDVKQKRTLPITKERAPAYFSTIDPDAKDQLHACLMNAAADGCVELVWGKHFERHLLRKIVLLDSENLARFLNIPLARDMAAGACAELASRVPADKPWLAHLVERIEEKWARGEPAYRMAPGSVAEAGLLIDALAAVKEGKQKGLDLRTFSARVLGDSKAMERMRERFGRVWNEEFSTGLESRELFEKLDLVKFPQPIFLKGPICLRMIGTWLDIGSVPSFLGLPPDMITEIKFPKTPDYVLTIENTASFNRHAREVGGKGLIINSAGFLGPATAAFLQELDRVLADEIPFFHWGDIDVGGLRIANHIQSQIGRILRLHLMSSQMLSTKGEAVVSLPRFKVQAANDQIQTLMKALARNNPPLILEQENIDPKSPDY
jgi:hypothetical protein